MEGEIITIETAQKLAEYDKLKQLVKNQKEVIDKAIDRINDYKIYCKENKGFTEYTDIEIEAMEPILTEIDDILKVVR